MPRATNNVAAQRRHKKVLQRAKGNFSGRSRLYRTALETVHRGMRYAYRDRRAKKREFRALWITRISAAAPALRHQLFEVHAWPEEGRSDSRPQGAGRYRRSRYGDLHQSRQYRRRQVAGSGPRYVNS